MNSHVKRIINALSLRAPQEESLRLFSEICDIVSFSKQSDLEADCQKLKAKFPVFTSFERTFPTVCFALATGIGKTRLMGAFIAYLYYEKGIKNFFIMAPNLTIYRKLRNDFSNVSSPKYVFKGLDAFVEPPKIIDGENYEEFRQTGNWFSAPITINIFNISKWNSESKGKKGTQPRTMRLNEFLGQSYFEYLQSLPDLCLFMDESHHYRAEKSFNAINDLQPVLGVEVTATPQVQKGSKVQKFKNVVYEYSLAHALKDEKYVKVPAVITRKDFDPAQYDAETVEHIKLQDGIRLHIDIQSKLDVYGRTHNKPIVKPIVLIVAKDTEHSKKIRDFITSESFFHGVYKDKVLEINSNQSGMEKDENIELLESLEQPENKIEIVIHVNMLKEGWDVNNLYTIISLRASASETLTEQTIGRGLRLPYGERTGVDELDRLSIVSHDKFEAIVSLANDPNSLVRKVYFIDPEENPNDEPKETVALPSRYEQEAQTNAEQIALSLPESVTKDQEQKKEIGKMISNLAYKTVQEIHKQVKNIYEVSSPEIKNTVIQSIVRETQKQYGTLNLQSNEIRAAITKAVEFSVSSLTNLVIPIPRGVVQAIKEVKSGFFDFDLDTRNIHFKPSDENTLHGQELKEDGAAYELDMSFAKIDPPDTPENDIAKSIIMHDNIDYEKNTELIFKLIEQIKTHLRTYLLTEDDVEMTLRQYRADLAEMIYAQMNQHFYQDETKYSASEMYPFSKIESGFGVKYVSDQVYDFRSYMGQANEIKKKIFKGFKKSCHTLYKFDSDSERIFAIVLENDKAVEKWMCPDIKQFSIYYDHDAASQYQPDFVVEIADKIYMIEVKNRSQLQDEIVQKKAHAAMAYCRAATTFNEKNSGKPWEYAIIPHDSIHMQSSFIHLVKNKEFVQDALF